MNSNKTKFILNNTIILNYEGQIKYKKRFFSKRIITFYRFTTKKGL